MTDRERTIRGLECCSVLRKCAQQSCPYIDDYTCTTSLARDALNLLREQDTVEHALAVLKAHGWKDDSEVTVDA